MIPQALDIAKRFEGFSPVPYLCPAGFWTIGYGHLCTKDHPRITLEQGNDYLDSDMASAYANTVRLCPNLLFDSPSRLAAIVDFTFNLGSGRLAASTLRRRINSQNWEGARKEIRKWCHGGGRVLAGLVARREVEALML